MPGSDFKPRRLMRGAHLQSMLASSSVRRWLFHRRPHRLKLAEQSLILDCGQGVRLQGMLTEPEALPRGLVVLLHGWEGSADSNYMLHTGGTLLDAGFSVFRLNFRDHGQTHHLNEGLFHSCRIDEVVGAVAAIADRFPRLPLLLAGYSLGGNFALRVALRAPAAGISLAGFSAICPVISPASALEAIERAPFVYHSYFVRKWRRSLEAKQLAFPGRFDFSDWRRNDSLREMTRKMVVRHSDFRTLEEYLDGYSVAATRLAGLSVPGHILTAEDDPVIPVRDFQRLTLPECVQLSVSRFGGHCGFIDDYRCRGWAEHFVTRTLISYADAASPERDHA